MMGSCKLRKAVSGIDVQAAGTGDCRNTPPRVITAQAIRAILLAKATATTRRGLRASSPVTPGSARSALERSRAAWAPMISSRRR